MDKTMKKNIKRGVALCCIAALVALLAAMPLIARQEKEADGPQASILSGTVGSGTIDRKLLGGGTLTEEAAVSVPVPSAVKLTGFLVSNGDAVREGDPIATVDRVTVMTAIAEVQETLDLLAEKIEEVHESNDEGEVIAHAGGIVKILYAQEGESVQDVMLEHGALAVLSLDGLMAVDLSVESDLEVGTAVLVTLSDGTQAEGKVNSNLAGEMTVTVEDGGYPVQDSVTVSDTEGTVLGSGELYIYSPWNASAYAGTVKQVKVTEGESTDPGDTLMKLSGMGYSATYWQLMGQRQEYEDLMLTLFKMYQSEQIIAPCDGIVSGMDEDSLQLLSNRGEYVLRFLANAPNGDDGTAYINYVGQIIGVGENLWSLKVLTESVLIEDYMDLSGVSMSPDQMTKQVAYQPIPAEGNQVPVYGLVENAWVQLGIEDVAAGDVLLFAADTNGDFIWIVRVGSAEILEDPTEPSNPTEPSEPSEPTEPSNPTEPSEPSEPTEPTEPSNPSDPDQPTQPSVPGGSGQSGISGGTFPTTGGNWSGSFSGSMSGTGSYPQMEQEPEKSLYSVSMTQIAAVTPQDTMTVEITVDEQDITGITIGMAAYVKINALGGEKFEAVISQIGNTGTNSGGSSKFAVELTLTRGETMLSGMNATVSLVLDTTAQGLTIPAAALVEEGTRTVVYTGYDEENECLTGPVAVTVGLSDGETVQILDGMEAGMTYYYAYYDTLEISFTPDFGGGGFMFGG